MNEQMIMVQMGGTRKTILASKLSEAQEMANKMYNLAIKVGYSMEKARELFALEIVQEPFNSPK